ncbi:MAG: DUF4174 domain-containing protein [Pseudomonadota bacterium]
MKHAIFAALASMSIAAPALANGDGGVEAWRTEPQRVFEATEIEIGAFTWVARPVVVFADSPLDPAFQTQVELLTRDLDAVSERDILLVTDTDPEAHTDLRRKLRPRGFMLVLMGKDGGVKLRKPFPWDMRELGRAIDKMPMRQREISERRGSSS